MIDNLIRRDLKIMFRNPRGFILPLTFFLLFLSLFAIALGGDLADLNRLGAIAIWLAAIFSLLLSFENLFQRDIETGIYDQMQLSGLSAMSIFMSKMLSIFLIMVIPLIAIVPIAGIMYQLEAHNIAAICLSVLIGGPAIIALGVFSAALMSGQRNAGFMTLLMTLPFIIPVVIFALSGIEKYPNEGLGSAEFIALAGITLISLAVCIPAGAAALNSNTE